MNFEEINKQLIQIIELRNKLSTLSFNDDTYDEVEENVQDLEDDLAEEFGKEITQIIEKIYDELSNESEPEPIAAYIGRKYFPSEDEEGAYEVDFNEGVFIKIVSQGPHSRKMSVRLVILPSPFRFAFSAQKGQLTVWSSAEPTKYNFVF